MSWTYYKTGFAWTPPRNPKTLAQTPQPPSSCSAKYIVSAKSDEISVSTSSDVKCPAAVMAFCQE